MISAINMYIKILIWLNTANSEVMFENNKIILYYLLIFQKKSGKPRAEVIAIGEPPAEDLCTPSTSTPSPVTDNFSTPVRFWPCRTSDDVFQNAIMREMLSQRRQQKIMMKKLDIVNQRIVASESLVRNGNITTDALMDIATRRRFS